MNRFNKMLSARFPEYVSSKEDIRKINSLLMASHLFGNFEDSNPIILPLLLNEYIDYLYLRLCSLYNCNYGAYFGLR